MMKFQVSRRSARRVSRFSSLTLVFSFLIIAGCGDDSDKKTKKKGAGSGGDGDELPITGSLAVAVPTDLQVKSPFQSEGSQTSLRLQGGEESSKAELEKTLSTEEVSGCAAALPQEVSFPQGNIAQARCFGPSVEFTGHPDLSGDAKAGGIGNGDLGMWQERDDAADSSSEPCAASVINSAVQNTGGYVDLALSVQTHVACLAKFAETKLAPGESLDLTQYLDDAASEAIEISKAVISESEDDAGNLVLTTEVEGKANDVPRNLSKDFTLKVENAASSAEAKDYFGHMQFSIEDFENSKDLGVSVSYSWQAQELKYRYRQVQFDGAVTFGDSKELVANSPVDPGFVDFVVNKKEEVTKLSFSWNTFDLLVFNAETKSATEGVAHFGHASSSSANNLGVIGGLRCLPINPLPNGAEPYSGFVQRQTMTRASATDVFNIDESNITFAPTLSCSWNADNDASQAATFTAKIETGGPGSEVDVPLAYPTNANLIEKSDFTDVWVKPELPFHVAE